MWLKFLKSEEFRECNYHSIIGMRPHPGLLPLTSVGFNGIWDRKLIANRGPHPGPLRGRGCHILIFLTVIFEIFGIGHVIFKELLGSKFVTPN